MGVKEVLTAKVITNKNDSFNFIIGRIRHKKQKVLNPMSFIKITLPILLVIIILNSCKKLTCEERLLQYEASAPDYEVYCEESSFLFKVTRYDGGFDFDEAEYGGDMYRGEDERSDVVAYFRNEETDEIIPYLFCRVEHDAWEDFEQRWIEDSWGKSFHEYIFKYKCDCD